MKCADVMKTLEKAGVESWRKIMPNHGIREPYYGVRYADLYKIQKKLQPDTKLAKALFQTGNHDARILATLIVDPSELTARDLDAWIKDADNYVLNEAIAGVAARSPHAQKKAEAWRRVKGEWKSAAGWEVVAHMSRPGGEGDDAYLEARLDDIEAGIHDAPNRTRHSMNQALISIGGYRPALEKRALAAAKAIGKVEVDHGKTSCKTPDATGYIKKVVAHAKKKASKKKASRKKAARKKAPARKASRKKVVRTRASKKANTATRASAKSATKKKARRKKA